jgi:hypothetical protein
MHRPPRCPHPPLAGQRDAVALSDFVADDHEIELALVEKGRDIGTDTELDLQPDRGVAGGELPKQGGERVQLQSKDTPRVGQEDFAMLGQPDAARIAHDQARADLIFKTFDVKTHRRLSEIHLARSLGKAAGVADRREGS